MVGMDSLFGLFGLLAPGGGTPEPWHDLTIAIATVFLAGGLVPSLLGSKKPELATSSIHAVALAAITFVYASLGLWFSTTVAMVEVLLWAALGVQVYVKHHR